MGEVLNNPMAAKLAADLQQLIPADLDDPAKKMAGSLAAAAWIGGASYILQRLPEGATIPGLLVELDDTLTRYKAWLRF